MALTVSRLAARRAGRPVLRDLDLSLARGAALVLRGPNGAGKSTLLRVLAGLLPREGGEISLGGLDPDRDADSYSGSVAYAGHLDAIKPQLTVGENVAFWAGLFGATAPGSVTRALEALDLAALAARPAHACSAGQKRRLGLARLTLAPRPLWLLDEPTVGLDSGATATFCAHVRRHCAAGGMAIVATHVALDLGPGDILTLTPPDRRASAASDPFLAGGWG